MLEHVINKSTKSDFVSKIKYSDSDDHKKKKITAQITRSNGAILQLHAIQATRVYHKVTQTQKQHGFQLPVTYLQKKHVSIINVAPYKSNDIEN